MLVAPYGRYTKELRDVNGNGVEDRSEPYQVNDIVGVRMDGRSLKYMIKDNHLIVDAVTLQTIRCGNDANMLELVIHDVAGYSASFDESTTSVFARIDDVSYGGDYDEKSITHIQNDQYEDVPVNEAWSQYDFEASGEYKNLGRDVNQGEARRAMSREELKKT